MIHLSHIRASVRRSTKGLRTTRIEQKYANGEWSWNQAARVEAKHEEALMDKLREMNRDAQLDIVEQWIKKARFWQDVELENQRKQKARKEYKEWLNTLPLSADQYKEDPERMRYPGGPDMRAERRSFAEWADLKARERWPEEAAEKKRELREKYGLYPNTPLI